MYGDFMSFTMFVFSFVFASCALRSLPAAAAPMLRLLHVGFAALLANLALHVTLHKRLGRTATSAYEDASQVRCQTNEIPALVRSF